MYEFLCEINLFTTCCWSSPYSSAGPKDKNSRVPQTCFWERTMYHKKRLVSHLDGDEALDTDSKREGHLHQPSFDKVLFNGKCKTPLNFTKPYVTLAL